MIFILIDYEKIAEGFMLVIPKKYRHFVIELRDDVEAGMNRYFRGQALVAAILSVLLPKNTCAMADLPVMPMITRSALR